jgi:hypothetical protein
MPADETARMPRDMDPSHGTVVMSENASLGAKTPKLRVQGCLRQARTMSVCVIVATVRNEIISCGRRGKNSLNKFRTYWHRKVS